MNETCLFPGEVVLDRQGPLQAVLPHQEDAATHVRGVDEGQQVRCVTLQRREIQIHPAPFQIHPVRVGRDEHPAVEGPGVGEAGHYEGPRADCVRLCREAQGEVRASPAGKLLAGMIRQKRQKSKIVKVDQFDLILCKFNHTKPNIQIQKLSSEH